jgi:hypothetical protein
MCVEEAEAIEKGGIGLNGWMWVCGARIASDDFD